jgi:hypothetical protein
MMTDNVERLSELLEMCHDDWLDGESRSVVDLPSLYEFLKPSLYEFLKFAAQWLDEQGMGLNTNAKFAEPTVRSTADTTTGVRGARRLCGGIDDLGQSSAKQP